MNTAKKIGNGIGNTLAVVPREVGVGLHTGFDVANSIVQYPKQIFECLSNGVSNAKNIFKNAFSSNKKWRQMWFNLGVAPITATGAIAEWAVRGVLHPSFNLIKHTKENIAHVLTNTGRNLKTMWSTQPFNEAYSYDHMEVVNVSPAENHFIKGNAQIGYDSFEEEVNAIERSIEKYTAKKQARLAKVKAKAGVIDTPQAEPEAEAA